MLALERARALSPELARMDDEAARVHLSAAVARASRREETVDHRTGDPQSLVWLPWGVVLLKGETMITALDEGGARNILARARAQRRVKPSLEPLPTLAGQIARFAVRGWPGVTTIEVAADGTGRALGAT